MPRRVKAASVSSQSALYCSPGKKNECRGLRPSASRNSAASRGYSSAQKRTRASACASETWFHKGSQWSQKAKSR